MSTAKAKDEVMRLLERLPDDASLEESRRLGDETQ